MKKVSIFILITLFSSGLFALDIYDDIGNALRSGDSRQLATFFGPTIDLTIGLREDVYSKGQAELILKDFFAKNQPKSFTVLHKGSSKEGTLYAIGSLFTVNGKSFRTSFYIKSSGGKSVLEELRIESE